MRLSIAASVLACASAHAFSDSSPFVLLSTIETSATPSDKPAQLQSSSQVLSSAKALLDSCPTERYLLISQPNVHASDLRCTADEIGTCRKAPNLKRAADAYSVLSVAEVLGRSPSFDDFAGHIKASCMSQGKQARVSEHTLKDLPAASSGLAARESALADNDQQLGDLLDAARTEGDYTAIYFSNPNEPQPYDAQFVEPVHMELVKRHSGDSLLEMRAANRTVDFRGVFHKYQFFTPGIFMGLFAMFIMLAILYVGLQALSSLQVSYGAFEKEMGPSSQKKHG